MPCIVDDRAKVPTQCGVGEEFQTIIDSQVGHATGTGNRTRRLQSHSNRTHVPRGGGCSSALYRNHDDPRRPPARRHRIHVAPEVRHRDSSANSVPLPGLPVSCSLERNVGLTQTPATRPRTITLTCDPVHHGGSSACWREIVPAYGTGPWHQAAVDVHSARHVTGDVLLLG